MVTPCLLRALTMISDRADEKSCLTLSLMDNYNQFAVVVIEASFDGP